MKTLGNPLIYMEIFNAFHNLLSILLYCIPAIENHMRKVHRLKLPFVIIVIIIIIIIIIDIIYFCVIFFFIAVGCILFFFGICFGILIEMSLPSQYSFFCGLFICIH